MPIPNQNNDLCLMNHLQLKNFFPQTNYSHFNLRFIISFFLPCFGYISHNYFFTKKYKQIIRLILFFFIIVAIRSDLH